MQPIDPNVLTLIKVVCTVIGAVIANLTLIWRIIKSFESRIEKYMDARDARISKHLDAQDERIFQLATGKSLKDAMLEAKKKAEGQ